MGKIETVLRSEVARLARKQVHAACQPLAREVRRLKRVVAELSRTVRPLAGVAREFEARRAEDARSALQAAPSEVERARISPGLIRKLRKRLAISQAELARLMGVSSPAVAFWERGRSRPSEENKSALVALRRLGRRDVRRRLDAAQ